MVWMGGGGGGGGLFSPRDISSVSLQIREQVESLPSLY